MNAWMWRSSPSSIANSSNSNALRGRRTCGSPPPIAYAVRMAVEKAARRTKADVVYEALQSAILAGNIRIGEHLRQEDIAEQWSVSQTPVREAFRRLEAEGLVEYAANRGVIVRGMPYAPPAAPLDVLARRWHDLVVDPDSVPGSDFP